MCVCFHQSPLISLRGSKGNPCHGSIHTLQLPCAVAHSDLNTTMLPSEFPGVRFFHGTVFLTDYTTPLVAACHRLGGWSALRGTGVVICFLMGIL